VAAIIKSRSPTLIPRLANAAHCEAWIRATNASKAIRGRAESKPSTLALMSLAGSLCSVYAIKQFRSGDGGDSEVLPRVAPEEFIEIDQAPFDRNQNARID
jgi:hypothetical protein